MRFSEFMKDKMAMLLVGWGLFNLVAYPAFYAIGGGEGWAADATYLPYDGAIVLAVIALLLVVRFYGAKSFEGRVWGLIAAGLVLWLVAELIWGIEVLLWALGSDGLPAVLTDNTDYPFLAGYVFIALGFLYKARFTETQPDPGKAFLVMLLVGVFVMFSSFLVIIPAAESTLFSGSEKFFIIAYIVLDILLFGLALAIAMYWGSSVSKGWYVIAAGLLSMMIADVGYTALDLKGIYFDGSMIELAWVFAYLLIGLAGLYQKRLHESFM